MQAEQGYKETSMRALTGVDEDKGAEQGYKETRMRALTGVDEDKSTEQGELQVREPECEHPTRKLCHAPQQGPLLII